MNFSLGRVAGPVLALLLTACGSHTHSQRERFFVGFLPEIGSSQALWPDQNTVFMTNRPAHAVAQFTLTPAAHVRSFPLARVEDDQIPLPSADGTYAVTVSGYGYAVIKQDGTANVDPQPLPGYIKWVAFHPGKGYLALLDDAQNLVLVTVGSAGDVSGTWSTKSQLQTKEWATAMTMLEDGTLAVAGSGTHVALIDVAGSVQDKAWKETDVAVPGATSLSWIAAVEGLTNDAAFLVDAQRLVVVDLKAGTALDTKSLGSDQILGRFRDTTPHVVSQSGDELAKSVASVTYVNASGKLATSSVSTQSGQLSQSFLDLGSGNLALVFSPGSVSRPSFDPDSGYYATRQIQRYKADSGAAVDATTINDRVAPTLRPDQILAVHPSSLGEADIGGYGSMAASTKLEGYDYQVFTKQFAP